MKMPNLRDDEKRDDCITCMYCGYEPFSIDNKIIQVCCHRYPRITKQIVHWCGEYKKIPKVYFELN